MQSPNLKDKNLIAVFFVAAVAAAGGNYGTSFFRADSFTGTQGKKHEKRITDLELAVDLDKVEMAKLFQNCKHMGERVTRLEDGLPPKWLLDRVDRIEEKADTCQQILKDMGKFHGTR